MKYYLILTAVLGILGCFLLLKIPKREPLMLDGPGSVYVDSEYRTDYANALPFEDIQGPPYAAVVYLGQGDDALENKSLYTNRIFSKLDNDRKDLLKHFDVGGNDWFLIIPKYRTELELCASNSSVSRKYTIYDGAAFTVCCDKSVDIYLSSYGGVHMEVAVDANGELIQTDDSLWDIKHIDKINN